MRLNSLDKLLEITFAPIVKAMAAKFLLAGNFLLCQGLRCTKRQRWTSQTAGTRTIVNDRLFCRPLGLECLRRILLCLWFPKRDLILVRAL